MLGLFTSSKATKATLTDEGKIRMEIQRRQEINTEARKMAVRLGMAQKQAPVSVQSKADMLRTLDGVLDGVSKFDNIKISTLCELYNAIETGDTKNLINFLKKKEKVAVKKTTKKKTWEL